MGILSDRVESIANKMRKCLSKQQDVIEIKARKHCRKRRKCWTPAFSPFPTFSKFLFPMIVKKSGLFSKGLLVFLTGTHKVKQLSYGYITKSVQIMFYCMEEINFIS